MTLNAHLRVVWTGDASASPDSNLEETDLCRTALGTVTAGAVTPNAVLREVLTGDALGTAAA